jgi:hypothetical protein
MLWVGLRGLFLSAEAACLIYTSHAISLIDDRPSKPAAPRHSWRIHILSGPQQKLRWRHVLFGYILAFLFDVQSI